MSPTIKLLSSDKQTFDVDIKVVKRSNMIKTMLEDLDDTADNSEDEQPIPLPNVKSTILKKVLEWCTYHRDDPPTIEGQEEHRSIICEWDKEFLKIDQQMLYDIILAANYLDIKDLMDVACKIVADQAKGKTSEEMRILFNIPVDQPKKASKKAAADSTKKVQRKKAAK